MTDLSFQTHFAPPPQGEGLERPPEPWGEVSGVAQGRGDRVPTFSPTPHRITQPKYAPAVFCLNVKWVMGRCEHDTTRWRSIPCKKRTCPVCGQRRRESLANRIAYGVRNAPSRSLVAWFVGTWSYRVNKETAVRTQNKFIRWLRRDLGMPIEYAATWEHHKSGQLHLNLVMLGWSYISQRKLSSAWQRFGGGRSVWIKQVSPGISTEVTKANADLSEYVTKLEQAVLYGKAVNFSRGWPKQPPPPPSRRHGIIQWTMFYHDCEVPPSFEFERQMGWWLEVANREYIWHKGEPCQCFERQLSLPIDSEGVCYAGT